MQGRQARELVAFKADMFGSKLLTSELIKSIIQWWTTYLRDSWEAQEQGMTQKNPGH